MCLFECIWRDERKRLCENLAVLIWPCGIVCMFLMYDILLAAFDTQFVTSLSLIQSIIKLYQLGAVSGSALHGAVFYALLMNMVEKTMYVCFK